jgi:hypothetical protein
LESLKKLELSMCAISKRVDDEQARNQESLKKIESGLISCKREQARASEERTDLTARLFVVERKSSANLDRDNTALTRIEAVDTRLQAINRKERELRNRVEKVEVTQAEDVSPEMRINIKKLHEKIKELTFAISLVQEVSSRIDAIESSLSKAKSDASRNDFLFSEVARIAGSIEDIENEGRESKPAADIGSPAPEASKKAQAPGPSIFSEETLKAHSELMHKIAQPRARSASYNPAPSPPKDRSVSPPRLSVRNRCAEFPVCVKMESQPTQQANIFKLAPDAKSPPIKSNKSRLTSPRRCYAW